MPFWYNLNMTGEDTLKTSGISEDASLWASFTGGLKSAWNSVANTFTNLDNIFGKAVDPTQTDTSVAISTDLRIDTLTNQVFLDTGAPLIQQENDGVIVTAVLDRPEPTMVQTHDGDHKILRIHEGQIPFEEETKTMQMQLLEGGYELPRFGIDGLFGKETDAAVRQLQREAGLKVDGEFGVEEQIALDNKIQLMNNPVIEHATRTNETSREFASARDYQVDSTSPRGIRNNNPGNIDFNESNDWQGQTGIESQGRFATFETPQHGIRAMTKLLQNYDSKYDFDTLDEIVNRYAPNSENNTSGYVDALARKTGLNPNETINLSDPATMKSLVTAMIEHENGMNPYSDDVINQGLQMAGLQVSTTLASGPTGPNPMS